MIPNQVRERVPAAAHRAEQENLHASHCGVARLGTAKGLVLVDGDTVAFVPTRRRDAIRRWVASDVEAVSGRMRQTVELRDGNRLRISKALVDPIEKLIASNNERAVCIIDASEPPPPPRAARAGIVRVPLRPTGYVEVDGVLLHARWRDSEPPPSLGESVRLLAHRDPDGALIALRRHSSTLSGGSIA